MNWLNINLSTLRTPAYMGSSPTERATWLQVIAYCVDQENGGVIAGGGEWKDRQWQQTCGVTLRELKSTDKLISVKGSDICVMFYPHEKESEVQAKREAGRKGGLESGRIRASSRASISERSTPRTEGEGNENRNGNRTEGKELVSEFIDFETFWKAYPKKAKQGEAQRLWMQMIDRPSIVTLLEAIEKQKSSDLWKDQKGRFIPNPSNWLADKRWLDEDAANSNIKFNGNHKNGSSESTRNIGTANEGRASQYRGVGKINPQGTNGVSNPQ